MCLAVPGKILSIDGLCAVVDFCGVKRQVLVDLLPDPRVGEYVLVHAGFAIQRLESSEAAEIFKQFEQIAAEMQVQHTGRK